MKKVLYILSAMALLTSCDRVYINGELDGMWRLETVVYPDRTVHPQQMFYSFQRHMTQISEHNDSTLPRRFLGNLYYDGTTLTMSHFYVFPHESYPATAKILEEFHLYSDSSIFRIQSLDDELLIMKSGERTYTLRKW